MKASSLLRILRVEARLSQAALGQQAGLSPASISLIERRYQSLSSLHAELIAAALGAALECTIAAADLLEGEVGDA